MFFNQETAKVSDYAAYTSQSAKVYFGRAYTYLSQRLERPAGYGKKTLCDGPLPSYMAPFHLAWNLGLLPMKEGKPCEDAPVFYALEFDGYDLPQQDPQILIEILVDLLQSTEAPRQAVSMIIEFHDFLAVRDKGQALRFVTEISEDYASRHDCLDDLLCIKGDGENLSRSENYPATLRQALLSIGWLDKAITSLEPVKLSRAYRRLQWKELAVLAQDKDLEHVLGADLGL